MGDAGDILSSYLPLTKTKINYLSFLFAKNHDVGRIRVMKQIQREVLVIHSKETAQRTRLRVLRLP